MAGTMKVLDANQLNPKKLLDRLFRLDDFVRRLTAQDENAMETLVAVGAFWKAVKKRQVDPDCLRVMEEASDRLTEVYLAYLRDRK